MKLIIFCAIIVFSFNLLKCDEEFSRFKREVGKADDPLLTANLFEGDIAGYDGKTRVSEAENMWLNREIPYKLDQSLGHVAKRAIFKAINEFEQKTCVRFRNITGFDQDHLLFIAGRGCFSYVGKHGGPQDVSVGKGCESVGIVLHLLMHAIGYWHEQSRLDRDNYVLIHYDNIAPGKMSFSFKKHQVAMS